jgi:hypothetical protein
MIARGAALAGALAFASRLPFLPAVEQDLDGSRFCRALLRFDLAQGHPHPPGYPVFIALGRAVLPLVDTPARALSLVSAAAFGATCALTFALSLRATRSRLAASAGAAFFAVGTLTTIHSARPLSDMLGCALAWCALALSLGETSRPRAGFGALAALLAGARPSALPLLAPSALRGLARLGLARWVRTFAAPCAALVALAYAPVVMRTGPSRFVALVAEHAHGHFTRFGGTVVTQPHLVDRLRAFAFALHAHALGGWWSDRATSLIPATLAAWALLLWGIAGLRRAPSWSPVALACGAYAVWALFGQNVVWQPRHLLPLAPGLALLFALGVRAADARARPLALALTLVALAPIAHESWRLLCVQSRTAPPALRIADAINRRDARATLVATGQLGTWLRYRASERRVVDVRDLDEALALARRNRLSLCVTSEVRGVEGRGLTRVARFVGDRYVTATLYDLALWCIEQPFADKPD